MDPEVYPDPTRFDPWRSYRLREAEKLKGAQRAHVGAANQLVTVSPTALNFGYGRHACPGRFFAANEIKMMLGRIVLNYDVKNVDGSIERYPNLYLAESVSPSQTLVDIAAGCMLWIAPLTMVVVRAECAGPDEEGHVQESGCLNI